MNKLFNIDNINFTNEIFHNYRDAIRFSAKHLINQKKIDEKFFMILEEQTKKYGFYYILNDDMAFPHISPCDSTLKNGTSFTIFNNPVKFENENCIKEIRYVLILVSVDGDSHMDLLQEIVTLWNDSAFLNILKNINCENNLINILNYVNGK